ncbi:MAG: TVP38/TMEM64 family protein [Sulfurospirillum sp.]|jgi:uncharacterized membrane protein YdjX (TVP38/TMEM64 family)|nr:TVP38/TMEM64 family protein [Sulfurospirillum sp. 'SP']WNY98400.1 TVP38/TMEM64 family protein [Sulfurospirillum sp. 'SP']
MFKPSKIAILLFSGVALTLIFICPQSRNYFFELVGLFQSLDIDKIKEYILSFGVLAPLISFLLMVFQAILAPLPAFLITFANAALFGWVYGAALSWASAMVGALLCFYIAQFLGRDVVEKLTSKMALESVDAFFERHGVYAILIARLLPFISFDVVSYAAGLTSMKLRSFLVATGIGQLPATLVYSYVGGMLTGDAKTAVYGLLILFSVTILIYLIKRVYRGR